MQKQLKVLLESELLNDETKKTLTEAIEEIKTEALEEARKELDVSYAKKFNKEKTELNKNLVGILNETIESEMKELREDIESAKKTEIKYAKQLQEFKEKYATKLSATLEEQVREVVEAEMKELREDIEKSKQNRLGQRIFEAYLNEFKEFGVTEDYKTLSDKLAALEEQLDEQKAVSTAATKKMKIATLLENLSGSKKEVMRTILENVEDPEDLEARYEETIDSVVKDDEDDETVTEEDEEKKDEEDDETVTEEDEEKKDEEDKKDDETVTESKKTTKGKAILENSDSPFTPRDIEIMRRRAGIEKY